MRTKRISKEEADAIIETKKPEGLFYLMSVTDSGSKVFVGIDNRTGDAWTEDFKSKSACLRWLRSK